MKHAAIILAGFVLLAGCDGAARSSKDKTPPLNTEQKLGQQFYEGAPDKLGPGDVMAKRGDIKVYIDSWSVNCFFYDDNVKPAFKEVFNDSNFESRPFNLTCSEAPFSYNVDGKLSPFEKKYPGLDSEHKWKISQKFNRTSHINTGHNLLETWRYSLNAQGKLYKLTLTARQGNKLWTRNFESTNSVVERQQLNCKIKMDGVVAKQKVTLPDDERQNRCAKASIPDTVQQLYKLLSDDISE